MQDIARAIADAWLRLAPKLERDPRELRRRLARRRSKLINQPPRAWCIALRAGDTRLARYQSTIHDQPSTHEILVPSDGLKKLCAPVYLTPPGQTIDQLMKLLGVATPAGLLNARVAGVFQTHYVEGLGGRWGKPHPLMYTKQPLDPASRLFALDDPVWAATARHLPGRIPGNLNVILTRVPYYASTTPAGMYEDNDDLHPEHPHADRGVTPILSKRNWSKKLPPPPPDVMAWYKWKGDEYIGYDWRAAETNPRIRQNYERRERRLAKAREADKRRRRENPAPTKAKGSLTFRGYRFRCHCCQRLVKVLYYPLPRVHLLPGKLPPLIKRMMKQATAGPHFPLPGTPGRRSGTGVNDLARPIAPAAPNGERERLKPTGVACQRCHKVKFFSFAKSSWGEIVAYLSAGLLYGNEVQRPASYKPQRKNKYTPRINRPPSKRRPQVEKLLLAGLKISEIATRLGLSRGTVRSYAERSYHCHGVCSLRDFLRKHGHNVPPPITPEIRRRILAGQSNAQIERELGVNQMMISNQRQRLRKDGHKLPDGRKHNRPRRSPASADIIV